nr:right-handed parallel beta-helix repeat-containing protein [uncultured Niameybacter sp.]
MTLLTKIYAKDFGILPNTNQNMTKLFCKMLEAHPSHTYFILEKGIYKFSSDQAIQADYYFSNTDQENPRHLSILMKDMDHIVLDGAGSTFIYAGQTTPIAIDHSSNITVKDITIDWDIPLSAEGEIVASCKEYVDMHIDPKMYPHTVKDNLLWFQGENWQSPNTSLYNPFVEFNHITKKLAYRTGDFFYSSKHEQLSEGIIRFHGNFNPIPTVGNYGVLRHNKRLHPGLFLYRSSHITLENITLHMTGGLGILTQFCDTLHYKGIRFSPNYSKGRRVISGHDDGLHFSNNKGSITVENCWFYGLMDDPINVHGTSVRITEVVDSHTLKGIFVHHQAYGFDCWAETGHEISFIENLSMASYGTNKAKDFKLLSPTEFEITFEDPIPQGIKSGDALENLTNTPSLLCRNNYFGSCRARGVLVSTPGQVIIENNVFDSAGSGILIAGDANQWYESGACTDVIIRNNHFNECVSSMYQFCEGIISICPEIPQPILDKSFHRNIHITDNTFTAFDYSVLYALSVDGLEFSNNKIIRSYMYEPYGYRHHMINLDYCQNVRIENNALVGDVLGQDIHIKGMSSGDNQEDVILLDSTGTLQTL